MTGGVVDHTTSAITWQALFTQVQINSTLHGGQMKWWSCRSHHLYHNMTSSVHTGPNHVNIAWRADDWWSCRSHHLCHNMTSSVHTAPSHVNIAWRVDDWWSCRSHHFCHDVNRSVHPSSKSCLQLKLQSSFVLTRIIMFSSCFTSKLESRRLSLIMVKTILSNHAVFFMCTACWLLKHNFWGRAYMTLQCTCTLLRSHCA